MTLSPKTSTAETGSAGSRQLTTTIAPSKALDKTVTYSIAPAGTAITVSGTGLIEWTEATEANTYTTTVTTTDGSFTDTHLLTLSDPLS